MSKANHLCQIWMRHPSSPTKVHHIKRLVDEMTLDERFEFYEMYLYKEYCDRFDEEILSIALNAIPASFLREPVGAQAKPAGSNLQSRVDDIIRSKADDNLQSRVDDIVRSASVGDARSKTVHFKPEPVDWAATLEPARPKSPPAIDLMTLLNNVRANKAHSLKEVPEPDMSDAAPSLIANEEKTQQLLGVSEDDEAELRTRMTDKSGLDEHEQIRLKTHDTAKWFVSHGYSPRSADKFAMKLHHPGSMSAEEYNSIVIPDEYYCDDVEVVYEVVDDELGDSDFDDDESNVETKTNQPVIQRVVSQESRTSKLQAELNDLVTRMKQCGGGSSEGVNMALGITE